MPTYAEYLAQQKPNASVANTEDRSAFISKVFVIFGLGIGLSALGVWFAMTNPTLFAAPWKFYVLMGLTLIIIFTMNFWAYRTPLAYFIYAIFTFIMGITLVPLLMTAQMAGGTEIIFKALVGTLGTFLLAGFVGATTKKDLSGMGGFLMIAVIGLIVMSIVNMFLESNLGELIISSGGVLIFSLFIVYDMQNIMKKYPTNMPMLAAVGLFLSVFNLFTSFLRFLMAMNNR